MAMNPPRERGATGGNAYRERVDALKALELGDDTDFRRLTRMAGRLFDAPVAFLSLLVEGRQLFFARLGFERTEGPAAHSVCETLVNTPDLPWLVVPDAQADPRFAEGALVADAPFGRFWVGTPVLVRGQKVGALCVLAPEPREAPEETSLDELADLAALSGSLFELKDEARVRARMAAELIKEEWRHALTLEAGRVGSWVWDLRSGEIVGNDIFRRMFGLPPTGPLKVEDLRARIDGPDIPGVNAGLEAAFHEGTDYNVEFRVNATGRWLIGRGRVYQRDAAGRPLVMMGVNIDVTDARQAAEQTRLLLRELNHRVKNTLAMIQSIARQTLRRQPDPQQFIDSFSGRLRTLSEAHMLLADRDWSGIWLGELIRSQVEPYLAAPEQMILKGEDVELPPDHALGLGLILHELASNAAKYGALSAGTGRVSIGWEVNTTGGRRRLGLDWVESGGPAVTKPEEAGFGMRLIERSLDKVLDSSVRLSFSPGGVETHILMPLE
jgi:two-component sensor histidine kinase/PAS domain-containing protein